MTEDEKKLADRINKVDLDLEDNIKFLKAVRDGDSGAIDFDGDIPLNMRMQAAMKLIDKQIPDKKSVDMNLDQKITLEIQPPPSINAPIPLKIISEKEVDKALLISYEEEEVKKESSENPIP